MKRLRRSRVASNKRPTRDELEKRLSTLLEGRAVRLQVNFERQSGKSRREIHLLVLIAPGEVYGMKTGKYLVSVLGKGSTLIDVNSDRNISGLVLSGIPVRLAKELERALKKLQEK